MRVLHILNELRPSGAETMLRAAAAHWRRQGIAGEILSTGERPGEYAEALRAAGYAVHHLPFSRSVGFLWAFFRFVRRGGFDVLHIHTERAGFWYAALGWAAGQRRMVRTIHAAFAFGGGLRWRRAAQRWVMRRILGVRMTAGGASVAALERERFGNVVEVLGSWFDSERFRREPARRREGGRPLVLLTVGNCATVKNHEAVLRALAELPEVEYAHVGCEGSAGGERALAEALGVTGRVRFLGPLADVRTAFREADLFVMPSLREGFGVAAVEAMGAGLPVVLADVEGLRDFRAFCPAVRYAVPDAAGIAGAVREYLGVAEEARAAEGAALSEMAHRQFGVAAGAARYAALYRGGAVSGVAREVTA